MRRSLFISLIASTAMLGCEDGPNQTFSPAPAGAGDFLNNGKADASVDPGTQNFDASYPGRSLQEICSADEKRARWAKMVDEKIEPPRIYAGLDMAKSDLWEGLKVEDAEQAPPKGNCQADNQGSGSCGSGSGVCGFQTWGDNGEVSFSYNLSTHIVDQMQLNLGYTGHITFKDRSGTHTYSAAIGDVWRKDGQPFLIPWADTTPGPSGVSSRNQVATELYNAMMFTFGPKAGIPWPTTADSADCKADRGCLLSSDGGDGNTYFGVRPLAIYFQTPTGTPQPVISTPRSVYNFFVKTEPYSNLAQTLELSATGPYATGLVGSVTPQPTCTQIVGLKFSDLLEKCVKVTGDPMADTLNYNKLVGGRQHDFENWSFNVVGVNQNFTKTQGPFDVVQDTDVPTANDVATDWTFDVRAKGQPSNDYSRGVTGGNVKGSFEARGIALIYTEWARLMLADAASILGLATPKRLGDPTCAPAAADLDANGVLIAGRTLPAGCTGIEGMLIPPGGVSNHRLSFAPDPLDPAANWAPAGPYDPSTSMSPGDPKIFLCTDPGTYGDCDGPGNGSPYDTLVAHVQRVMGGGNLFKVPAEFRDRRYFFRWFGVALVKYLKAYGAANPATRDAVVRTVPLGTGRTVATGLLPTAIKNQKIDLESLFFDNSFSQLYDKIEYIERDFMTATGDTSVPWDFEWGIDVKFGNQRYQNWFRRLDREEQALYTAMTVAGPNAMTKTDPPGKQKTVTLTNLFGSPVLANAYPDFATATAATEPKDLNGTAPAFSYYPGVWGKTVFSMGHSPIQVTEANKLPNVGAAKVIIPNYLNPHAAVIPETPTAPVMTVTTDAGAACANGETPQGTGMNLCCPGGYDLLANSMTQCCPSGAVLFAGKCDAEQATGGPLTALVPWIEQQPGIGFSIPINGSRDKQVTTAQLDFTGNLETYLVDFEPWQDQVKPSCSYDKKCNAGYTCDPRERCVDGTIRIDAIEASDFLGEVFPCQDPTTGELLRVRQYTSALVIVDWLASHPGAQAACDILIKYSPYNNYIDFITSRANGVKMAINAGQGLGRVVDVTLFDPTFLQQ